MPAAALLPTPFASPYALFDDNQDERGDLLLRTLRQTLICEQPAQLMPALAAIEAARAAGCWVALALSYEAGYLLEPRLAPLLPPERSQPLLLAWIFEHGEWRSAAQTTADIQAALAALDEHARLAGIADLTPQLDATAYHSAVTRIRELIHAGDCYQVNFTFPLQGRLHGAPLALYEALRQAQPVRHGACIDDGRRRILSRSPELFVERQGKRLRCRPMKGTAPRDSAPQALASSEKNRAENVMIVDLIRNDLGRLTPPGGVRVDSLCEIEAYPSVWQMTSSVSAAPVDASLVDILRALFPCGSVTGAPRIRAMEIIRALESTPRGLYCGALGWLAPDGDFRLNVPIRTLVQTGDDSMVLGIGSGIVADSDPAAEWQECLLKSRFLSALPAGFALFETLLCHPADTAPYPLLARHLARLSHSAASFGFRFDPQLAHERLVTLATRLPAQPHRVRLQLTQDGQLSLHQAPLDPLPADPTVALAEEPLDSTDLLLRHKTTARARYDRALAQAQADGHFDLLFFNERGELAEGARSTVFVELDGQLCTPPLACGLLDGVLRRELLEHGRAVERILLRKDLALAEALYLGNALRGLFRVQLV
jgi:para-aminobenzoate synthetase / 4-amino-4-deoxychorismate lyase